METLSKILPETKVFLAPMLNTAYEIQKRIGQDILTPLKVTTSGSWNTHIFVDGVTQNFHSEKDCAYTCIHVPKQDKIIDTCIESQPTFLFKLNDNQRIMLPLTMPVSFMYNAQLITHRQAYYPDNTQNMTSFINVSSYGNEKIFNHLRKTFQRIVNKPSVK